MDNSINVKKDYNSLRGKRLKIYSEDWFTFKLFRYTSGNLPNTREYIISKLRENPNFIEKKGIILKQDIIDQYFSNGGKLHPKFSFEKVPEVVHSRSEKFTLICLEKDKSGKIIGDYTTNYNNLVTLKQVPLAFQQLFCSELSPVKLTTEKFIEKAIKIHGNKYDYSQTEYINSKHKVKIYCNSCKEFFLQTPTDHLSGCGCPKCADRNFLIYIRDKGKRTFIERSKKKFGENKFDYSKVEYITECDKVLLYCNDCKKWFLESPQSHLATKYGGCPYCRSMSFEEFIQKAKEIHGNLYDYSKSDFKNVSSSILIIDTETGEEFYQLPFNHLRGSGNPSRTDSRGERFIRTWLLNNNISCWEKNYSVTNKIEGRNIKRVYIDFSVTYNGKVYWIEYNGYQHYSAIYTAWNSNKDSNTAIDDFKKQVKRDKCVKDYCIKNNIIFIEIPYTYNTYSEVSNILNRVIINGETDLSFIDIPKIIIPDDSKEESYDIKT